MRQERAAASFSAARHRVVFPMPGWPSSTRTRAPSATRLRNASIAASSVSRPIRLSTTPSGSPPPIAAHCIWPGPLEDWQSGVDHLVGGGEGDPEPARNLDDG